ncbi:MAG: ComF family protein [Bacteroidota bacterium]
MGILTKSDFKLVAQSVKQAILAHANDFLSLLYPDTCIGCNTVLLGAEKHACLNCILALPLLNNYFDTGNPVINRMAEHADVDAAFAYMNFVNGGISQKLVHALKYKGKKQVGVWLGIQFGHAIMRQASGITTYDLVLPVPLHANKQKKRGYNQSDLIAEGIALSLGIPVSQGLLIRTLNTETQTHKSREQRKENVRAAFAVPGSSAISGKSILLTDDVFTTGATAGTCVRVLLEAGAKSVSVAALAYAGQND